MNKIKNTKRFHKGENCIYFQLFYLKVIYLTWRQYRNL